jgi:copper chaperone CopZ
MWISHHAMITMVEKLTLKVEKTEGNACPTCGGSFQGATLENTLMRLNGVSKARYDEVTYKVKIEYDPQKVNPPKITERLQKLGYRVQNA